MFNDKRSVFKRIALPFFIGAAALVGCSDSNELALLVERGGNGPLDITKGPGQVSVFSDLVIDVANIEPPVGMAQSDESQLFDNTGFEQGVEGWSNCKGNTDAVSSTDAYAGNASLQLNAQGCIYRSAIVTPGDKLQLSCVVKISDTGKWAGLGLGFANDDWAVLEEAPTSLITSKKYTTYQVSAVVPENAHYASMWLYSDSVALADNCTLVVVSGDEPTQPPVVSSNDALVDNQSFSGVVGGAPDDWYQGCDTKGAAEVTATGGVLLSGGACLVQSFSANDVSRMAGNLFAFECAVSGYEDDKYYADIVIGFDGIETAKSTVSDGKLRIAGRAPAELSNGFIGIYSELPQGKELAVSQCSIIIEEDEWLVPRDLDGDMATIEAYYDAELDITWLADTDLGRTTTFSLPLNNINHNNGSVSGVLADQMIVAMNQASYLGHTGWRLPAAQSLIGVEDTGCSEQYATYADGNGCTAPEVGRMNVRLLETYTGISNTPFLNLSSGFRWVGTRDAADYQYLFSFGGDSLLTLDACDVALQTCEIAAVWPVHPGDIGNDPDHDADGGTDDPDTPQDYDFWPNPVSQTNGDQWLYENHDNIKSTNPKVLVLSFGNTKPSGEIDTLVDSVINAFTESSRADGYENPSAEPQLNYQLAKLVDLRDGIDGRPQVADDYPYQNSTLYPRPPVNPESTWLDYSQFFTEEFSQHYGYEDPDNSNEFLTLCELIDSGTINELWFAASGDVPDASAYEVLENKQVYDSNNEPVSGNFNRCAGNGCFANDVPSCSRSVRIGFINESRGPGCYLHSQGHSIESVGRKNIVPAFAEWFVPFAGFDLNTRFGMPFESFYESCGLNQQDCLVYPGANSVTVGGSDTYDNYFPVCGNIHFPPNADKHYGSTSDVEVSSQCDNFGRPNSVGVTETTIVSQLNWQDNSYAQDCSGEFISWWYQHMPAHGTNRRFENTDLMKSIWPFLFY